MPEERQALRPDQPPLPDINELAAIKALFNCRANEAQQALFVTYLMKMCGESQSAYGQGEFWPFMGGRRWVATELMKMADVRMVPLGVRKVLEKPNDD
jgi:hypothetical protein